MPQPTTTPAQIVADTIIRTVELGVRITDAALAGRTTVVFADLLVDGPGPCPGCGLVGVYRDTVERRVPEGPVVGHPLVLRVRLPRYRCLHDGCVREVFAHDSSQLARPGTATTRRCAQYVLRRLALDKATISTVARELGRSWDTVNDIAGQATRELLLAAGPARLDGVEVLGVDEHKWSHVLGADADGFVTVIPDLPPVVAGHGPARLLDMVPGRSAAAFSGWLAGRDQAFRDRVAIVAMDGFGGYKNAAAPALPEAVTGWIRSTSSPSPGTSSTCAVNASNRTPSATAAAPGTRSTASAARCAPAMGCSTTASGPGSPRCSPTTPTPQSKSPGAPTNSSSTRTPPTIRSGAGPCYRR